MKKRLLISVMLLAVLLLFTACGKMSDEKAIAAMKESDELWINYGLAAWEAGTETEDVSGILSGGYKYLSLHNFMFTYDEEKSAAVAEDFFRFVADKYGLAAVLDTDKRVAYKTEYLHSLGFEFDYARSTEEENFFRTVTFQSDDTYAYIFTYKNASFTFTDLDVLGPNRMQTMIYDTCEFIDGFAEVVREKKISDYFDPERTVTFHCEDIGRGSGVSHAYTSGYIYMKSTQALTHEYVHAVSKFSYGTTGSNTMLSEVVASYFPEMEGLDAMLRRSYYNNLTVPISTYDKVIEQGGASADGARYWKRIIENYLAIGGKLDSYEDLDMYLVAQAMAMAVQTGGLSMYKTLAETYDYARVFDGDDLYGDELSAFGYWLIDEYGLKPVLEVWKTNDFYGILGKDYETVKSEWLEFFEQYKKHTVY